MNTRKHTGFTLIELVIAMFIVGALLAFAGPRVAQGVRQNAASQAGSVVALDLEMAMSLAARQRQPIRIAFDADRMQYRFVGTDATEWHTRTLGSDSEYKLNAMTFTPSTIDIMPTGVASAALTVKVTAGSYSRTVTMSRVGHVRLTP